LSAHPEPGGDDVLPVPTWSGSSALFPVPTPETQDLRLGRRTL